MNRRALACYAAGVLIFFAGAFMGRDFSSPDDIIEAAVFFVGFMLIMLFMYWMERQGLIPWGEWDRKPNTRPMQ